MKPILTAECIVKSFGARRVLSSATLRAVPGELRVLFGRNGIAKSTLLKIAGLFYLADHDLLSPPQHDAFCREYLGSWSRPTVGRVG